MCIRDRYKEHVHFKHTPDVQEAAENKSSEFLVCTPPDMQPTGRLFFWSYVYYLSKYYEFLDTVLLAVRKKPMSFLHVFHHATVVGMAWLWVDQVQSLTFIGIMANTLVHVRTSLTSIMRLYACT